ncbi:HAMP domain-containing sensor histidine kinase [Curvibacter sp. APW13]|uniref:sensor histidine kinase n=1 Tax=Curvibacter sp. APW13 TaxID=3077236 RepID=UPI0028E05D1D|nr:HAMP domain-containing sensor histidine kinase [Curvibacter sp. APW13]MDT8990353.1 HAMP domain-containing sensor histidine kinase [Curvibacter sp. APW13]
MNSDTLAQRALLPGARLVGRLYWATAVLNLAYLALMLVQDSPMRRFIAPAGVVLISALCISLQRRQRPRAAMAVYVWGVWTTIALQAFARGGVHQPALFALPALFMVAGWVLGVRQGVMLALASIALVLVLAVAEQWQWLDLHVDISPLNYAVPLVLVLLVSLAVLLFILQVHWKEVQQTESLNQSLEATVAQLRAGEEALHRSEQRFFKLNASSPLPIAVTRLEDGRYLYVNAAWERTFGWDAQTALEKTAIDLRFWESLALRATWIEDLRLHGRSLNHEMVVTTRSGQRMDLILNAEFIDFDGQPAVLAVFLDQSERKRTADELHRLNTELEQRVQARTAELSQTLDMLKRSQDELVHAEKLASLGSLVAGVAHELNTPIGNALVSTSALADLSREFAQQYARGDLRRSALEAYVQQCSEGAELAQRSLRRASELVHSFKQVAVDQSSERRRSFDLSGMLHEVVDTLRPNAKGKPWQIRLDVAPGIAMESYPGPLGQVVINLVMNALLHAFEGRERGEVVLQGSVARPGWVTLSCSDDGQGIAPEHLPRIFDPFFTTKLGQGGSGLGLAIVHRLVTQVLQGDISVESTLGHGTRFVLSLPLLVSEPQL